MRTRTFDSSLLFIVLVELGRITERSTWPLVWPARMQCGPLASSETTATSQGRAR